MKNLEEWNLEKLLIFSAIFVLGGFALGNFFKDKGVIIQILSILIMFTGLIFLVVGIGKLVRGLEQRGKIEIEQPKIKNFKEFIRFIIVPLLISVLITYWFEIRPRQIRNKCFIKAINEGIDEGVEKNLEGENVEKDIMSHKFHQCLKKYKLEK